MDTPAYHLEKIQQIYRGRTVLDVPEMEIKRGEILAVAGPSGAGKSTLLRLLSFLERPARGNLAFNGQPAGPDLPIAERRRVTMLFQAPHLLRRSVTANLAYGCSLRGKNPSPALLSAWLDRLGLGQLAHQPARNLSAGEAQRVALGRALLVEPEVLLLDEPTANLDPFNVALIETILKEEQARLGFTLILVTHNLFQARRLAQQAALLYNGFLVEIAPAEKFFSSPDRPETRAFIQGEMVY